MKNRNYKVWQFDRYERTSPDWELHEIRECNGHYLLVVNIYDANGAGCMFPERFPTFEEAKTALDWFFPGTRALFREKKTPLNLPIPETIYIKDGVIYYD